MSTQTLSPYAFVSELPAAAEITFHDVTWEEYEELLEEVGEASGLRISYDEGTLNEGRRLRPLPRATNAKAGGLRISYDEGTLNVMTLSAEHECYERFHDNVLTMYFLEDGGYEAGGASRALPMLTAEILTRFLSQLRDDGDFKALISFDEWFQSHAPSA